MSTFSAEGGLQMPTGEFCKFKYSNEYLDNYTSPFYNQILNFWYELYFVPLVNCSEAAKNKTTWYNKHILIDKNCFL